VLIDPRVQSPQQILKDFEEDVIEREAFLV
jgi:hypothetical protein